MEGETRQVAILSAVGAFAAALLMPPPASAATHQRANLVDWDRTMSAAFGFVCKEAGQRDTGLPPTITLLVRPSSEGAFW